MTRVSILPILAFAMLFAHSAEAAPPPNAPPPTCRAARDSADYVAGVDVHGKPVAPAEAPGGVDIDISTQVFAEVKTNNPQLRGVGVDVRLKGLEPLPLCPPAPPPPKPRN